MTPTIDNKKTDRPIAHIFRDHPAAGQSLRLDRVARAVTTELKHLPRHVWDDFLWQVCTELTRHSIRQRTPATRRDTETANDPPALHDRSVMQGQEAIDELRETIACLAERRDRFRASAAPEHRQELQRLQEMLAQAQRELDQLKTELRHSSELFEDMQRVIRGATAG